MRVQQILAAAAAAHTYSTQTYSKHLTPDFEVKALLNASAVLGPDNKLSHSVLTTFDLGTDIKLMHIQFLDTDDRELYENGWSPRIRRTDDDEVDPFELTYKRRYAIEGYEEGIDDALHKAHVDGFDHKDENWDAQIEWGYTKLTLSLTRKKEASSKGYHGIELPEVKKSRSMLKKEAPGKFVDWSEDNWGIDNLEKARIYGPIATQRSTGTWSDLKVHVEVWPIKAENGDGVDHLVEISFKTDDQREASKKHDELIEFLTEKGWFLPKDSLKSRMIMDRY